MPSGGVHPITVTRGVRTPSGRGRWHAITVRRALVLDSALPVEGTVKPPGEGGTAEG